ncbi:MAG: Tim44 domain-containing protein [Alphaproteobacteria bacterium]|nr:Tim44 domain-containing protein [Alphaproteobacteria bacterium]
MFDSFAPLDILILAVIAGVVLYRLYRQFGTRIDVNDTKKPSYDTFVAPDAPKKPATMQPLFSPQESVTDPDEEYPSDDRYAELHKLDETFDEKSFLEGASIAFDMIVTGLAEGDTKTLKPLLDSALFDEFCAEIKRRRSAGNETAPKIIGVDRMAVRSVSIEDSVATLVVEIESEQVHTVCNAERNLTEGHTDELLNVHDVWHFQRNLKSHNPNWLLVFTKTEEDSADDPEEDPSGDV